MKRIIAVTVLAASVFVLGCQEALPVVYTGSSEVPKVKVLEFNGWVKNLGAAEFGGPPTLKARIEYSFTVNTLGEGAASYYDLEMQMDAEVRGTDCSGKAGGASTDRIELGKSLGAKFEKEYRIEGLDSTPTLRVFFAIDRLELKVLRAEVF